MDVEKKRNNVTRREQQPKFTKGSVIASMVKRRQGDGQFGDDQPSERR